MKSAFKKIFLCVFILTMTTVAVFFFSGKDYLSKTIQTFSNQSISESDEESDLKDDENFAFVKNNEKSLLYNGGLLLYGGIFFIAVSILGIFFTLKPKKKVKNLKQAQRYKNRKRSKN